MSQIPNQPFNQPPFQIPPRRTPPRKILSRLTNWLLSLIVITFYVLVAVVVIVAAVVAGTAVCMAAMLVLAALGISFVVGPYPSTERYANTTFYDSRGQPVMVIAQEKLFLMEADRMVEIDRGMNLELVDGTVWSPLFLKADPPAMLGVCDTCRYPPHSFLGRETPTHGLALKANLQTCCCGKTTCPRHGQMCSDGHWRCVDCLSRWKVLQHHKRIGRGLLRLFFKERE
jgi:hypothetical protein